MKMVSLKAMVLLLLAFATSAMAITFYFLPPYDPDWMRKYPRVIDMDNMGIKVMQPSKTYCGWYEVDITNLSSEYIIWQGHIKDINNMTAAELGADRVGALGLEENKDEWKGNPPLPEAIRFNALPNGLTAGSNTFFDPQNGSNGWATSIPTYDRNKYCKTSMAGLVYDTHAGLLSSFSHENTGQENNDNAAGCSNCSGVRKGIPKSKLVKNNNGILKMEFNQSKNGWANATEFNQAFNCTSGKNAMVCYNIPFSKDNKGLWTFDSDYLCKDGTIDLDKSVTDRCVSNTGSTYGFFPDRLNRSDLIGQNDSPPLDASCTYSNCSSCASTVQAESWVPLQSSAISRNCYEYSLSGTGTTGKGSCGAAFGEGAFMNGDNPKIWDWGWSRPTLDNKNEYFCFESHATFVYEKGQEFYFSGDDDIWVFIDSNLVIDLGGAHLAAPGYVALDSIGRPGRWQGPAAVSGNALSGSNYTPLEEGRDYNIDIFFCDRRRTMSNIRVSTNMYISQESGILFKGGKEDALIPSNPAELCVKRSGSGSCASLLGKGGDDQLLCGSDVNGVFEFYLQKRGGGDEKDILNAANENCEGSGQVLTCYEGIKIDMSTGKVSVDQPRTTLSGTWYLYAQVAESGQNVIKPPFPDPLRVAVIQKLGTVRTAYGTIREIDKNGKILTDRCKQTISAPTGQMVPICFSVGTPQAGGIFATEDFAESKEGGIGGLQFRLNTTGFTNGTNKLELYLDSAGTQKIKQDSTFRIPTNPSGAHPPKGSSVPGVLVLWVKSPYTQDVQTLPYKINVNGRKVEEEVTFNSIVPTLEWVFKKPDGSFETITTGNQKYGQWNEDSPGGLPNPNKGGLIDDATGKVKMVWVGDIIELTIKAYWMDGTTKRECGSCAFELDLDKAEAYGPSPPSEKNSSLIKAGNLELEKGKNGVGTIQITGNKAVKDDNYATFTLRGPSILQELSWDMLQFDKAPIPSPESALIFDRNGDGIGDSLVIIYNRGFKRDSLPNMIEVLWDIAAPGEQNAPIHYGLGVLNSSNKYSLDDINKTQNYEYWTEGGDKRFLHLDTRPGFYPDIDTRTNLDTELDDVRDTIIITRDPDKTGPASFSKEILTKNRKASLYSWATFKSGPQQVKTDNRFVSSIYDFIPAIVVSATYKAGEGCSGSDEGGRCLDNISLVFSEPVRLDGTIDATPEEQKNPFAYRFVDLGQDTWNILETPKFLPVSMNLTTLDPGGEGDSLVYLTFGRWRGGDVDRSSKTPIAGDSVKFASLGKYGFTKNILLDIPGSSSKEVNDAFRGGKAANSPNPNEIGVRIEGRKPFTQEKIPVGDVDPNNPDKFYPELDLALCSEEVRSGACSNGDYFTGKPGNDGGLFDISKPVEILPLPPSWDGKKAQSNYPGTVGIVLSPDVFNQIADMEKDKGIVINDEDISFHVKVFYHTNLGTFVANRAFSITCDDPIFSISEVTGKPSCRDSKNKVYIAWNMKDIKGRFVGTGAYVGIYDFRWEVKLYGGTDTQVMESIERKVEMHGVKRTKARR
jgi:fibro-slime domain-containing protein